jgi:putative RecB family exonuclease
VIKAWSPSRLNDYDTCPAKAKYKYIDRLPEPPAPALDRGTRIHAEAEAYIIGKGVVPADLVRVEDELLELRKGYRKGRVRVEQSIALDETWTPVDWFSRNAWLRCKLDVVELGASGKNKKRLILEATVTDWKTGKNNPRDAEKHGDQLNLYALAVISAGIAETVRARLVFTDTGEVVTKMEGCLTTKDVLTARENWVERVKPMMSDTTFDPTPNFTCRWCAFSKAAGGPCKF